MAQIPLRLNLSAQGFPLLSELQGRTVVIPQQDETQNQHSQLTQEYGDSLSQPAAYYMHNVIPTAQGFEAVGYNAISIAPLAFGAPGNVFYDNINTLQFDYVLTLKDATGKIGYVGVAHTSSTAVLLYLWLPGSGGSFARWYPLVAPPAGTGKIVTTAFLDGVTYLELSNFVCYTVDLTTGNLTGAGGTGNFTALTMSGIKGITTANGYLIAYSDTALYWSSTVSPTDFTPSLITGAGGGNVQDLKGTIVTVIPHKFGFMVYGTNNVIAGVYTANIRYPFSLKEVVGSGGVLSSYTVDKDPVSGDHYAYTESGLQLITAQLTTAVFPEITDFLSGLLFEDFNESTGVFTTTVLAVSMQKKLVNIADRYIVISYGTTSLLTHALVFDTVLKRLGKLKIDHTSCIELSQAVGGITDFSRNSITFVQKDGTLQVAAFALDEVVSPTAAGCLILGKFQLARQNICDLEAVHVENVIQGATFNCQDRRTLDGKNVVDTTAGYLAESTGLYRRYTFRSSGLNHSIVFTGAFNLVSVVAYFGQGGYR